MFVELTIPSSVRKSIENCSFRKFQILHIVPKFLLTGGPPKCCFKIPKFISKFCLIDGTKIDEGQTSPAVF